MPKGIPSLTEIQKQEIIKRVTDKGERAVDLAKEFKVNPYKPTFCRYTRKSLTTST